MVSILIALYNQIRFYFSLRQFEQGDFVLPRFNFKNEQWINTGVKFTMPRKIVKIERGWKHGRHQVLWINEHEFVENFDVIKVIN